MSVRELIAAGLVALADRVAKRGQSESSEDDDDSPRQPLPPVQLSPVAKEMIEQGRKPPPVEVRVQEPRALGSARDRFSRMRERGEPR